MRSTALVYRLKHVEIIHHRKVFEKRLKNGIKIISFAETKAILELTEFLCQ